MFNGDRRLGSGGGLEDECMIKNGIERQNQCIWQPLSKRPIDCFGKDYHVAAHCRVLSKTMVSGGKKMALINRHPVDLWVFLMQLSGQQWITTGSLRR